MSFSLKTATRSLGVRRSGAVKVRLLVVLVILAGFLAAAVLALRVDTEPTVVLEKKMRTAFEDKKYADVENYSHRILAKEPKSTPAILYGGEALLREGRPLDALAVFQTVVDVNTREAAFCHLHSGLILCDDLYKFREGEKELRRALTLDPENTYALQGLAFVLKQGTRTWERIPIALRQIHLGQMTVKSMHELALNERLPADIGTLLKASAKNAEDPTILLGMANLAKSQQKLAEAESLLEKAIQIDPDLDEAHVRLGMVLFDSGDDAKFLQWYSSAKPSLKTHPLYWNLLGQRAQRGGQKEVAARCYWEAVKIDPNLQSANYQLGQTLLALGRKEDAAPFLDRSAKLVDYLELANENALRARELGTGDIDLATRAVRTCNELANAWEALGWIEMTRELDKNNKEFEQAETDMQSVVKNLDKQRTIPAANPVTKVDLSKLPLPDWKTPLNSPHREASQYKIAFEDRAASVGISFEYFDGSDPRVNALNKRYQTNGGGIGALDYDHDGWPDLYFAQGAKDPHDRAQTEHLDRLYRNLGDGHFVDITAQAGIVENGFSQGVTVGDVDNDGFPDIFVCNIGANRLFLNNGDGTFSEAPTEFGGPDARWTTSAVLADLNGDSLPDLYAVGYIEGDALTRICNSWQKDEQGQGKLKRMDGCFTAQFPVSHSQVWINLGDGRFENATTESGIEQPTGKGLSVIAANVDGSRKLNLLIGNDGMPNFYFKNLASKPGQKPKFSQQAFPMGLGLAADGRPRSSFGVAVGDFNGDGLLDFHGTSAQEESDTLFIQQPGGFFGDLAHDSGLRGPTYLAVGYGTQCLDGDLDGNLDVFTANGNIDNYQNEYLKYEMSPSYFENDGTGHFTEVSAETLGPYFKGQYLGRAVARLDWNRDGREDVAVSHLRAPAALLTNSTPKVGHHLTVRLVSTQSARDSIGTTVEISAGGKKHIHQLTAGDGFQASNERALVFGLGQNTSAESVTIRWMSGKVQTLPATTADQEILVVEGRAEPVVLTRH